jgi:hypothetical protein
MQDAADAQTTACLQLTLLTAAEDLLQATDVKDEKAKATLKQAYLIFMSIRKTGFLTMKALMKTKRKEVL